ncbi:MAG: 1-deoxy-D-xylulose-5-phosphate reductoisomerase, partial [Planctomycetota bacterium]|nr:1-deoxy-D-xylulose-5-phosphate reductoisomerase [Planctomycetota bacterium]
MSTRRVIILGCTGSIGTQALDVVRHVNGLYDAGQSPVRLEVVGLAAGKNASLALQQAAACGCRDVAIADVGDRGVRAEGITLRVGPDAAERLVREVACDVVLAAIVGSAGLAATLAALELGRDVALANKETLVAAGALVVPTALRHKARLLPVDSEHAGVWQCLQGGAGGDVCTPPVVQAPEAIARVILTASGGPFRTWPRERIETATREEALKHPTWSMGAKVTVDSASLTNKALELIEAHWLFGLGADQLAAVIHPQSVVHAMIEMRDGGVLAQLATPDMRLPIQNALTHPARLATPTRGLELAALRTLEFEDPDLERFPALGMAFDVISAGGTAGAVFNAANEAAVERFLAGQIGFGAVGRMVAGAMSRVGVSPLRDLEDVRRAEAEARRCV